MLNGQPSGSGYGVVFLESENGQKIPAGILVDNLQKIGVEPLTQDTIWASMINPKLKQTIGTSPKLTLNNLFKLDEADDNDDVEFKVSRSIDGLDLNNLYLVTCAHIDGDNNLCQDVFFAQMSGFTKKSLQKLNEYFLLENMQMGVVLLPIRFKTPTKILKSMP